MKKLDFRIISFLGSLIVIAIAITIFFTLMSTEMPKGNREILISFVSVLFSGLALSIKNILGGDSKN